MVAIAQFFDLEAGVDVREDEADVDGEDLEFSGPASDDEDENDADRNLQWVVREEHMSEWARSVEDTLASLSEKALQPDDDQESDGEALRRIRPQLWKVKCKKGEEFNLCQSFLSKSLSYKSKEYPISSIFYRYDHDGFVLVELTKLDVAAQLLASHSCVARGSHGQPGGIDMTVLEENEADKALNLPPDPLQTPGTWACLVRPRFLPTNERYSNYDGDACLIHEVHWPLVQALVLPRIPASEVTLGAESARDGYVQILHTHKNVNSEYYEKTIQTAAGSSHGLYFIRIHVRHLRLMKGSLARTTAAMFLASQHRHVLEHFPQVNDWEFRIGEKVESCLSGDHGVVSEIHDHGVNIELQHTSQSGSERTISEISFGGWCLLKSWKLGDYLRHRQGLEGWVVEIDGTTVNLISRNVDERSGLLRLDRFSGHTNSFVTEPAPYDWQSYSGLPASNTVPLDVLNTARTFGAPWRWKEVVIWRGRHHGVNYRVSDVLLSQQTASGMKVQVETTVANSSSHKLLADYDDVVERWTLLPLHIIEDPISPAFRPDRWYRHPAIDEMKSIVIPAAHPQPPTPPRPATPPHTPLIGADTPEAWNPECQSPAGPSDERHARSQAMEAFHSSQRPFLGLLLTSSERSVCKFSTRLTGQSQFSNKNFDGTAKDLQIVDYKGQPQLAFQHYKRTVHVHPTVVVVPELPTKHTQKPFIVLHGPAEGWIGARVGCSRDLLQVVRVGVKPVRVHDEGAVGVKPEDCCVLNVKAYISDELNLLLKDVRARNSQHGTR
ncbi:hypothetical protein PQX77_019045 [Marasmius sp. AFHP31]|nr:hypothetical protein PQX77_019045 [Marasmius sp. AFHP31]